MHTNTHIQTSEQGNPSSLQTPGAVSLKEAKDILRDLIERYAPDGGSVMGLTASYLEISITSPRESGLLDTWRVGVSVSMPRFANFLCAFLAYWGVEGARRSVDFVVKAQASDEPDVQVFTILNGIFRTEHRSTEMTQARPFSDPVYRRWYGTILATRNFELVLKVLKSEIIAKHKKPDRQSAS